VQGSSLTLGTASQAGSLVVSDGSSNNVTLVVGALAGNYTVTIPTITGDDTLCLLTLANCGSGGSGVTTIGALNGGTPNANGASISGTTIYLQSASASFAGVVDTTTQTFAGLKTFNNGIVLAANQSLTVTGGNTASRPGSPTEGMVYFDTTTDRLLTYSNGKWQADRGEYIIVAANDSTQAEKDAADYVADGTADQTEINSALTDATGGKVLLLAGTYVANATILIPNNTTLAGVGPGTVIQLADIDATDNLIETTGTSKTGQVIRDLTLDGQDDLNTAGTQHGISLLSVGDDATSRPGATIINTTIFDFRSNGVNMNATDNTVIKGSNFYGNNRGINVEGAFGYNNTFDGNTITNNDSEGIQAVGINFTIVGNTVEDNGGNGIYLNTISESTVSSNTVNNNSSRGLYLYNFDNSTATGNTALNNASGGIEYFGTGSVISSNSVSGNTTEGIYVVSSTNSTIVANTVNSNSSEGIFLNGADNNIVQNNSINSNSYGIRLAAADTNIISGNNISNSGGTTANRGIYLVASDYNTISNNIISDTSCDSSCNAIDIFDSNSDKNYLEGNRYWDTDADAGDDATINDAGTNTIYVNQQTNTVTSQAYDVSDFRFRGSANSTSAFQVQNASGTSVLNVNTTTAGVTVGGTFTVDTTSTFTGLATFNGNLRISDGSGNWGTIAVASTAGDYTYTIPTTTANDEFCLLTLANCGSGGSGVTTIGALNGGTPNANGATITGTTLYLQSASASFAGVVDTTTQTFAGLKTFNNGIVLAANQSLTVTGGNTASRPGSPTEGMVYFDTTTDRLLTYSNGKWQADRGEYIIVAANDSTQAEKDAADYVADGTADQTEINSALTDATGGKVLLLAGTYVTDGTILVPNNTTLTGVGNGTVIDFNVGSSTDNAIEATGSTLTGQVIRNLTIDGVSGSGGTQRAILLNAVGDDSPFRSGAILENINIVSFRSEAIVLNGSGNTLINNITVDGGSGAGIYVVDSNNITITNNIVDGVNNAIWVDGSSNYITIDGNILRNGDNGSSGIYIGSGFSGNNTIMNNTISNMTGGNAAGISVQSYNTTIAGNTVKGSDKGIRLGFFSGMNIVDNIIEGGITGISVESANGNQISNNTVYGASSRGISIDSANNVVSNNQVSDTGGSSAFNGIFLDNADNNSITNNLLTDTACSTTCHAINISNAGSDKNYLEGNRFTGSTANAASINDAGTGTIYAGQQTNSTTSTLSDVSDFRFRGSANSTTAFAVQNASGTSVLNVNTTTAGVTVGGTLTVDTTSTFTGLATFNGGLTVETGDTFTFNGDAFTDFTGGGLTNVGGLLTVDATSATGFFRNGGNSFGGTATLGTNDANSLVLETNNQSALTIASGGASIFRNATNSTTAFRVQNAAGSTDSLVIDTTNNRVGIAGGTNANGKLTVNGGTISTSTSALYATANLTGTVYPSTVWIGTTVSPASSAADMKFAGNFLSTSSTSTNLNTTTTFGGVDNNITINVPSATTVGSVVGFNNNNTFGDNITANEVFGFRSRTNPALASGTIVNNYNFYASQPTGLGTITNNYGLYIQNQTYGTNDYGVYIEGADTYALFVDAGATRLDGTLEVQSSSTFTGLATFNGNLRISDGSGNWGTIAVASTAGNYTYTIPTTTANDEFCLLGLANCAGGAATLQGAYDGGNTITTANARDIVFNLANTATDSNFNINILGDNEFNVSNGTEYFSVYSTATLGLQVEISTDSDYAFLIQSQSTSFDVFRVDADFGAVEVQGIFRSLDDTVLGSSNSDLLTVNAVLQGASPFVFEGATADAFETTLAVADPTADRTITLPNASGVVVLDSTLTTEGDIYYRNGSGLARLARGTDGQCLTSNTSTILWGSCGGGSGVTTVGTFSGSSQVNGATISGSTITFGPADATNPGMISTGTQTIAGAKTFNNLTTFNSGVSLLTGYTFTNASSTLFTAQSISNLASDGNIGTAAATVDIATTFNVNQTTSGRTLTLPSPTVTTAGRIVYVNNVGSAGFSMYGVDVAPGTAQSFIWNGTNWIPTNIDGAGSGGTLFTDAGSYTYLTATSDDFVLGATSTASAALFLDVSDANLRIGNSTTAGKIALADGTGDTTTIQAGNSTGNLTFTLPTSIGSSNQCIKNSGTAGILTFANCNNGSGSGGAITLQDAYDVSSNPEIVLSSAVGGLTVRDASTPLGTNLFEVQNNAGSTTYFAVTASGASVTGTLLSSGALTFHQVVLA
jgi:parallel beta-helix repeat protein